MKFHIHNQRQTGIALIMVMIVVTAGMVVLGYESALYLLFLPLGIFIIASHRDNIERLLKGTERKIGDRLKL